MASGGSLPHWDDWRLHGSSDLLTEDRLGFYNLTINSFLPGFCFEKNGLHEVQLQEQTLLNTTFIHLKIKLRIVNRKCLMFLSLDILNEFMYFLISSPSFDIALSRYLEHTYYFINSLFSLDWKKKKYFLNIIKYQFVIFSI